MKRFLAFLLALTSLSFAAAQTAISPLIPKDARSMGLGGVFSALSWGFDSLYGNPAGFASAKGQLTFADLSTWVYALPTTDSYTTGMGLIAGSLSEADMVTAASSAITDNGLGGGFSLGFGYVGKGLGLGAYAVADAAARGATALGAVAKGSASFNAVLGFGYPIQLGKATLSLGGDVRPFYRADSEAGGWLVSELLGVLMTGGDLSAVLMNEKVEAGFALAMDFGAQLSLGSLSFGVSLRDLTPSFLTKNETIADFVSQLGGGTVPDFSTGSVSEILYPDFSAGLAWRPRIIRGILEPGFYLEIHDPLSIYLDGASAWNLLHLGVDLKLFSFLDISAGINKGWLSAGAGLNLYIVEINAAVFTEELGTHPGDQPMSGLTVQVSFHL